VSGMPFLFHQIDMRHTNNPVSSDRQ